jgi:hypothetical protein
MGDHQHPTSSIAAYQHSASAYHQHHYYDERHNYITSVWRRWRQ